MPLRNVNVKSVGSKILIVLVIVVLLIVVIYFDRRDKWTESYLDWVEDNPILGALSYILVYIAVTVLFVPGSIFSIGCGYVYSQTYGPVAGVCLGSLIVFIGASLGSIAAFLIGRYLFESLVKSWVEKYEKFAAIQRVTQTKGLRLMFLLRLSPIIPYNLLNYAMGLTTVTLRDYIIACVGMIPGVIAFVFLGTTITTISEASKKGIGSNVGILVFAILGTVLAFIGVVWVSAAARREIKALTENDQAVGLDDIENGTDGNPVPSE
jgi:uncharacterized membrane protein YdjX (TVP38/TMEM64 family)